MAKGVFKSLECSWQDKEYWLHRDKKPNIIKKIHVISLS